MNKRSRWVYVVSPVLFSTFTFACDDASSEGPPPADTFTDASMDVISEEEELDAGSISTSTNSTATNSTAVVTFASSGNSTSGRSDDSNSDAGTPFDAGGDAESQDASADDAGANTGNESQLTSGDDTSLTTGDDMFTDDSSGGELDAGADASQIENPTSEETPGTSGPFWSQTFWQGHVEPVGETTVVTVEDERLCFSGDETGTVGFWYNVNQAEGEAAEPFIAPGNVGGVNAIIETAGEYEMHFYANDTLYCSGVVGESLTYFLWGSFRECNDLFTSYDPGTAFTSVRFTYKASGEFDVCLSQFESGKIDAGVPDASL